YTKKSHRLISRILFLCHHLSCPFITERILLPTRFVMLCSNVNGPLTSSAAALAKADLVPPSWLKPTSAKATAVETKPTWHYSIQGLPAISITEYSRRLLPCVFTLTRPPKLQRRRTRLMRRRTSGYFLWHFLYH